MATNAARGPHFPTFRVLTLPRVIGRGNSDVTDKHAETLAKALDRKTASDDAFPFEPAHRSLEQCGIEPEKTRGRALAGEAGDFEVAPRDSMRRLGRRDRSRLAPPL